MGAFDKLSLERKILLIENEGELIMRVTYFEYLISLYVVNKSLVEVYFDGDKQEFVYILSITYNELDKYLRDIVLSGLPV